MKLLPFLSKNPPHYPRIILGSSLEALLYAFFTCSPLVFTRADQPHDLEEMNDPSVMNYFKVPFRSELQKFGGNEKISLPPKKFLWNKLFFFLKMNGLSLLPEACSSVQVKENELSCFTSHGRMAKFLFDRLIVFDDHNVSGLPPLMKSVGNFFKVIDWINVHTGAQHPFDYIQTDDPLVHEIRFYPNQRRWHETEKVKDALAISYLSQSDLDDPEMSNISVRFKVLSLMKEHGIKAITPLDIETMERELITINKMNIYAKTKKIKFVRHDYHTIFRFYKNRENKLTKLMEKMNERKLPPRRDNTDQQSADGLQSPSS